MHACLLCENQVFLLRVDNASSHDRTEAPTALAPLHYLPVSLRRTLCCARTQKSTTRSRARALISLEAGSDSAHLAVAKAGLSNPPPAPSPLAPRARGVPRRAQGVVEVAGRVPRSIVGWSCHAAPPPPPLPPMSLAVLCQRTAAVLCSRFRLRAGRAFRKLLRPAQHHCPEFVKY